MPSKTSTNRPAKKCNFKLWNLVLDGDESYAGFREALAHVENCSDCQLRVDSSASEDTPWWGEAKRSWLAQDLPSTNSENTLSSIVIEIEPEMPVDARIEIDSVALDFLGPPSHPELLGRLGRYEIERVIGKGGMGVVLKAHDTELHRVVAIKVLAAHLANNASARRRFAREAQAAAAVLHPNVIPIYNVESEGSLPYLVMQCVAGSSLQSKVDRHGPLSLVDVLRIAKQTAAGLAAAHDQGLVHRDVKPANILLEDNVDRVLLSDFGLARAVDDASLTRTGVIAGTPHYMSPEQARGDAIDTSSDQFSLGSVMYFMLAGRPPFRASGAMGVLHRICTEDQRSLQQINPDIPQEVIQFVDRLMEKKAGDRFPSMHVVEKHAESLLAALQSGGLSLGRRNLRLSRRSKVMMLSIGALIAILGTALIYLSIVTSESASTSVSSQSKSIDVHAIQEHLQEFEASSRSLSVATDQAEREVNSMLQDAMPVYGTDLEFESNVSSIQSQIEIFERQNPSSIFGVEK